ncbi:MULTISPECIES: uroporphyrinogen decarboxylase [unclassified Carboxylicivirga]|uniref:uroporphyrinogen decarboxylase n=1 Tax=Carboxylicivirga TaxID=1628153 RepID=UPI003D3435D5
MKNLFLDTIHGKNTERPPVWFMRQAGRVLPNYRALKENYTFSQLMEDPKLAAQVTWMPTHDLGVDAAILFSDILVVPEALGMALKFTDAGPEFGAPLHTFSNPVAQLKRDMSKLDHVYAAIDKIIETRPEGKPLIGFCGGLLTTFCFMFRDNVRDITFKNAIEFLYKNRKESQQIIDALAEVSTEYALTQVKHGVQAFQLFETYGGLLPEDLYLELFLPASKKILNAVRDAGVPTIYFPKDLGNGIRKVDKSVADFVGIDWRMNLAHAREIVDPEVGLQGNLDPRLLYASQPEIEKVLNDTYLPFGRDNQKWVFNLGHGILPDLPVENVKFVIDWVKSVDWGRK